MKGSPVRVRASAFLSKLHCDLTDHDSWAPGSFERLLERSATPIPAPNSVVTTFRTGVPDTESWGTNAVGHGWVLVDDALSAVH
jgi:hypothetical protein